MKFPCTGGIKNLSKDRHLTQYDPKDILFSEGDAAHSLYFIQKGIIKIYKTTESGKSFVTGLFGAGQFVGQLSLLTGEGIYRDTATVVEPAEVFEIPKADFTALLHGDKLIANKFITMVSNDVFDLQERLVSMAFSSVRQRMAKILVDLAQNELLHNSKNKGINITREDLANLIGIATETASRMLTNFKEEKLITIGFHSEIMVEDLEKLKHIVLFG